jgi:cold shock CspA family protein
MPSENYLPRFATRQIETAGARIHLATGGSGAPLLLLHGHPQTHLTWHKIAPRLAKRFTVVAPDLRGYGDSAKPDGGERHVNYSKRAMAADQVEVMRALGFGRFAVVGHDRAIYARYFPTDPPARRDVFAHISAVERSGMRGLAEGQKVSYDVEADRRSGKESATNLKGA